MTPLPPDKQDDWRYWLDNWSMHTGSYCLPVFDSTAQEWIIHRPGTNETIRVPHAVYYAYRKERKDQYLGVDKIHK